MSREQWWLINRTKKNITVGGFLYLPTLSPGKKLDLLRFISKEQIAQSSDLTSLIKSGKLVLQKKDPRANRTVAKQNAEKAVSSVEADELSIEDDIVATYLQGFPISSDTPTTEDVLQWDGSQWIPAASNLHIHAAIQVSDFDTEVSNNPDVAANTVARHTHNNLAQLDLVTDGDHDVRTDNPHTTTLEQARTANNALSGDIDADGNTVINLATPLDGSDAATKDYVDQNISGLTYQEAVIDNTLDTPPGGEVLGDRYIVAPVGQAAWAGHDNDIAEYNGAGWNFTDPVSGFAVYVTASTSLFTYNGSTWVAFGSAIDHGTLTGLSDDDHSQYHNNTRGDVRYYTKAQVDALFAIDVTTINANTLLTTANDVVLVDTSGGPIEVTLFTAVGNMGKEIIIKKITPDNYVVRTYPNGAETIDGEDEIIMQYTWSAMRIISNGVDWYIV